MEVTLQPALIVSPHPLTSAGRRVLDPVEAEFTPGESLLALLERNGVRRGEQWRVAIGGIEVDEVNWGRIRPKHRHLIEARRVPQKDVLRIVAFVALSYFTMGAGGIAGGSFMGLTGAAGWVAATAAFVAGSLVLNKMLAPKQVGRSESTANPTYSLNGGRNRMRPYEAMPLVLGEPYAVPDLASQPYTYFGNGEQYLWQMFHLGLNCADVTDIRIGQTSINAYQGVTILRNGLASGNSEFPALGTSVDSVAGALLTGGVTNVRTGSPGTVRLALDLVASLFNVTKDGAFATRNVHLYAHYRPVGSSSWLPFTQAIPDIPAVTEEGWALPTDDSGGGPVFYRHVLVPAVIGVPEGVIRLSNASQTPLRTTVELAVPPGQYEVMLSKIEEDYAGSQASNTVEWVQLKSYQQDNASYAGQSRLAINIQASGQLNGALDELNCQLRAKPIPYWNGSEWVTATDRASGLCNAGAVYLLLCRGVYDENGRLIAGYGYSDDRIDIEGLKHFMVHCKQNNFDFDLFLQEATSLEQLMEAVAYAGLGEAAWPDGKLGVIFFRRDAPVEGVINMASQTTRSFSVDYATMPTADEIEVEYFDRERGNTWQPVRVLAPGVTTPSRPSSTRLTGVTNEVHAALLARLMMAQNIYQRKTVTCEQDLEYMTHPKGTVTAFSHDMTQWGYGGRLAGFHDVAGTITLDLDDVAPGTLPAGASARFIGLRLPGETQLRVFPVAAFAGEARSVTLAAPWPVGVTKPGSSDSNPAHDTLWIYDFKAVPGQRLVVSSVDPSENGGRLTLLAVSDEFWTYVETGEYLPPPNNSLLQTTPVIRRVYMAEQLSRQGNTYFTEITVSFEVDGLFSRAELWGAVGSGEVAPTLRLLASGSRQSLSWQGGLDERWHLELRVYSDLRVAEPFRIIYDVAGLRQPPPPFDVFTVLAQPDGTRQFNFAYTATAAPVDWLGAEIRFLYGTHTTPAWEDMQQLQVERSYYTASPVEVNQLLSGAHTFACRSLDTTGNTSTIKYFQLELPPRRLGDTVAEFDDRAEGWMGELTDCEVNTATGGVEAVINTTWADLSTWDAWTRWNMNPADPIVYTAPVRDLQAVLTCLVDVSAIVQGALTIELRASETSSDPVADPGQWTAWGAADAKVVARYVQVRVTVEATGGDPVPMVDSLSYIVSAPLLNDYINDVDVSALAGAYRIGVGDVRVPMPNPYSTLLELQVVIQDARAGTWSWQVVDKALTYGPRVQFKLNGVLTDPDLADFITKGF